MSRIALIGHRGARGLFPENTLAGFRAAAALGIDAIELDVALSADGVAVVSHDPRLSPDLARGADGAWLVAPGPLIRALPAAALAGFDVGRARPDGAVAAAFPDQVAVDGARIPTLEAALGLRGIDVLIELKTFPDHPDWTAAPEAMAEAVLAAAERASATARIMVESFDWRGPRHLGRIRPGLARAWLTRAATVAAADLWWGGPRPGDFGGSVPRAVAAEMAADDPPGVWAPEHVDLTPELIAEAHDLGLRVVAWTVNAPADMARLIGWGIDGIVTDRPDLGRRALAQPRA